MDNFALNERNIHFIYNNYTLYDNETKYHNLKKCM